MASIGQIVYNLQDYINSGGLISTNNSNRSATVSSVIMNADGTTSVNGNYEASRIDITKNIVEGSGYTKVGIQAPPGTRAVLNTTKTILIGRTGIYELEEDILISSLYFIKPKNYILDTDATQRALDNGIAGFSAAEANRSSRLADLSRQLSTGAITQDQYWKLYTEVQAEYDEAYAQALSEYNLGINGVYKLDENQIDADLYNIIVDYVQ